MIFALVLWKHNHLALVNILPPPIPTPTTACVSYLFVNFSCIQWHLSLPQNPNSTSDLRNSSVCLSHFCIEDWNNIDNMPSRYKESISFHFENPRYNQSHTRHRIRTTLGRKGCLDAYLVSCKSFQMPSTGPKPWALLPITLNILQKTMTLH